MTRTKGSADQGSALVRGLALVRMCRALVRILGADLQKCMTDSADRLLFSFPPPPAGAAFFKSSLVCTQMALSQNLASPSEGALVVLATASDERHPASNILDGCVFLLCRGFLVSALRKSRITWTLHSHSTHPHLPCLSSAATRARSGSRRACFHTNLSCHFQGLFNYFASRP
jgi:hypothetical protein